MTHIETVLKDSLFLLRKQCQRQNVKLVERVDTDLPEIMIDVDRIKQVLLNLLNNALDAMPDGGLLTIQVQIVNEEIQLEVTDTGIGIASDNLPLVFEPFFTNKGQGTGLGLAISYNIISEHGGDIKIKSQPGAGTTVKVTLPIKSASPRLH